MTSAKRHTVMLTEDERVHMMSKREAEQYLAALQVFNGHEWVKPGFAYVARLNDDGEWVRA